MKLKVIRFKNIKNGTLGRFWLENNEGKTLFSGYTLEPAGPDTIIPNQDRRIPEGAYQTDWHNSPQFKRRLPRLYNFQVSPERYILIHAGNFHQHTAGCILLGLRYDEKGVYNSREALNKLIGLVKNMTLTVEIQNGNGV